MAAQTETKKPNINLGRVVISTVKEFGEDDMATTAGALTYFSFLAIFPLAILVITIASFFFQSPESQQNLTNSLTGAFGSGSKTTELVRTAIQKAVNDRGGAGIFSLFGLIFSASGIFGTLSNALTQAWDAKPKSQNIIFSYLSNIAALGVVGVLVLAVNIATVLLSTLSKGVQDIQLLGLALPPWVFYIVNIVFSVIVLWGVFILMYRFLPKTPVEFKDVILGSLIGAIGWTLLKELFGFYLANFGPGESTYGPLATIVALLLYIYFASMILLVGAEFCAEYSKARRRGEADIRTAAEVEAAKTPAEKQDPRDRERIRRNDELAAINARIAAHDPTSATSQQAIAVGAAAPQLLLPGQDPLPKSAPVFGVAAGTAVIAGAIALLTGRRKRA